MGFGRSLKRIMTRVALELGKVTKLKQDDSRKFIFIFACLCLKLFFWSMFKKAWDKAFTEKNIQSAFCKT
jgi:hypothetical protein